jgi:hypothetical protein
VSLIDEALKRAQEEAARRDAIRHGVPSPWTTTLPPRQSTPRVLVIALIAGGLAVGILVSLSLLNPTRPRAAEAVRVSRPMRTRETAAPPVSVVAAPAPPPASQAKSAPRPETGRARSPGGASVQTAAPPASAPASKEKPRALEDGRTYVREVPLPGGDKIELDGIVFSDVNPVVILNGKVLPVGGVVGEFTVGTIESERVELKGQSVTVWVSLK